MFEIDLERMKRDAVAVDMSTYTVRCTERRRRTLDRLFLLARSGFPCVALALSREDLTVLVNVLLSYIMENRDASPVAVLESALVRMRLVAAGRKLHPVLYKMHSRDKHTWFIDDETVTKLYTSGLIEAKRGDLQSTANLPGGVSDQRPAWFRRSLAERRGDVSIVAGSVAGNVSAERSTRVGGDEGSTGGGAPAAADEARGEALP